MDTESVDAAEAEFEETAPVCNLCGGTEFKPFKDRPGERCVSCKSLIRHRIAFEVYGRSGMFASRRSPPYGLRVLHFAPEQKLHAKIRRGVGAGYFCADAVPEAYRWAQCLKLFLPGDLMMFPEGYFDFVIHNHVMEHIPGTYRDHIPAFCRILKPGGKLIFSTPGPDMNALTEEGGEHFATDAERKAKFGQYNHLKKFGRDLPEFLNGLEGGTFAWDSLTTADRAKLGARPGSNRFMIWEKSRDVAAEPAGVPATADAAGAAREISAHTEAGIRRLKPR